jgi:hypothetical protein
MPREQVGDGPHPLLNASGSSVPSPDRLPPLAGVAPRLSSDDIEALRDAIERWLLESAPQKSPGSGIDEHLRKSVRVACAKARLQRVRAEHLVVDLKQLWGTIPSVPSSRSDERMNELVSACIDEYYSSSKDQHAGI